MTYATYRRLVLRARVRRLIEVVITLGTALLFSYLILQTR